MIERRLSAVLEIERLYASVSAEVTGGGAP